MGEPMQAEFVDMSPLLPQSPKRPQPQNAGNGSSLATLDPEASQMESNLGSEWRSETQIVLMACWWLLSVFTMVTGLPRNVRDWRLLPLLPAFPGILGTIGASWYFRHLCGLIAAGNLATNVKVVWGLATATWPILAVQFLLGIGVTLIFAIAIPSCKPLFLARTEPDGICRQIPKELRGNWSFTMSAMAIGLLWIMCFMLISFAISRRAKRIKNMQETFM